MLKALELVGFKSFADKTRFEFPEGITVIVGPNGSGKSNIVDAIKWVLGEQSAKSLRGKEMADVIFKGSGGPNGRRAMNTAEATLIFDNSDGRLAYDAPEVHVTRRVYRSGEGEYLINRQPCRLKDIRDLFRGTGVGSDAYSLIEQGKVDQLLQATPRDRRAIFEEAAGISRFKAKKIEAQRRLERVEQNLLRLSDIVGEVESRVRSVRAQAGKARRYKQYSDRLQQLRTHVGLTDWRKLTEQLTGVEAEVASLTQQIDGAAARAEAIDARLLEQEVEIGNLDELTRSCQHREGRNREQIAALQSSLVHHRRQLVELDEQVAAARQQLAETTARAGQLRQKAAQIEAVLAGARQHYQEVAGQLECHEQQARQLAEQVERARSDNEARRARYVEQMRAAARLGNQISACQSQCRTAQATAERAGRRFSELDAECRKLADQLQQLGRDQAELQSQTDQKAARLDRMQRNVEASRTQLADRREELSQLRLRHSSVRERLSVLQELDQTGPEEAGLRQLLGAEADLLGSPDKLHGQVAELMEVDVDLAPLVDIALGSTAHWLVVDPQLLGAELLAALPEPEGPVGLVPLEPLHPHQPDPAPLDGQAGVVGRLDRLVRVATAYQPLIEHLLGNTWLVDRLATALQLMRATDGQRRFVTLAGDLVETDGTIVIGLRRQVSGPVSRRSQLAALQQQLSQLEQQIHGVEQDIDRQQADLYRLERMVEKLTEEHKQAFTTLNACLVQFRAVQQRLDEAQSHRETVHAELQAAESQARQAAAERETARQQLEAVNTELAQLETTIQAEDQRIERLATQCQARREEATAAKVELATIRQQLESLQAQQARLVQQRQERAAMLSRLGQQLQQAQQRQQQTQRSILHATTQLAELYLEKESITAQFRQHQRRREELTASRQQLAAQLQEQRNLQRQLEAAQHQAELSASQLRQQRQSLAERLEEDYGIDISQLVQQPDDDQQQRQRAEIEAEIADLRRKLSNIGAVNMDALNELEELEQRYAALSGQYNDLRQAKESLERIISRINADSRRLFAETLEAIRHNFQQLYRKTFGGGRADIVLEDGQDILESGIEIIATPPGKPQFSNSLLSGGEKALTAVALLLAIFQYRPSPFCVLDEVDAPFDEASIGRFITVLKDFLGWTRFVIVTHSKKTMTAATTLYGITMQESGVSKRVSVRFDDVSEDGHISAEAVRRQEAEDAA